MNLKLLVPLLAVFSFSCGPDWGDCRTCKPGDATAESVDGTETVPEDTTVVVVVTVNNEQNQSQSQTQTTTEVNPPVDPPKTDAGSPPTCRKVCTCAKREYDCGKKHKHTRSCKHHDKCQKEVTKCS